MKKLKIPLAVLITLGLLLLLACLPKIVSGILDTFFRGKPSYTHIPSVKLDIDRSGQERSFLDKLFILKDAQAVDLNQGQAAMTEAEVEAAVGAFLEQCQSAGIYEPFEPSHTSMKPKLVYRKGDSSQYLIVWSVTMYNKKSPNQNLLLDVDDETGKILSVQYSIYRSFDMEDAWEQNKTRIDRFSQLYFEQLGMMQGEEVAPIDQPELLGYEYGDVDGGVSEAIYKFSYGDSGALTVKFLADGAGGFLVTILS